MTNRRDFWKTCAALPAFAFAGTEKLAGKARLRPAICAYSYRTELKDKKLSYEDLVRMAADMNIDGLDLTVYWFPSTSAGFLLPLKRLAYRMGVEIYSISVRTDMCQPTAELQAKEIAEVRKWVDVAATLGAGHIRVFGGAIPKGASADQAAAWCATVLSEASKYAGEKGVILGLENHGGITETADRIVQIVQKVDSPWVGVNLDTGNFRTNVYSQIEKLIPYSVNVQVKAEINEDGVKKPGDWERVAGLLAKAGYKGYLALEYEDANAMATMPPLLAKLRQVCQKYSA